MENDKQEIKLLALDHREEKISFIWIFAFLFLFFNLGLINNLG